MIALAVVLAVLLVILLLRVGAAAEYDESGFGLKARIGFIKITVLPGATKKKKAPKKPKEKAKKTKEEKVKKGGNVKQFLNLIPAAVKALGRVRKRLLIDELTLHVVIAGDDAAETAINYGRAWAVIGAITPLLDRAFRIKKQSITAGCSFTDTDMSVYCRAEFSIAVWAILYIAFGFLFSFIKIKLKSVNNRKVADNNGKTASDTGPDGNNNAENP